MAIIIKNWYTWWWYKKRLNKELERFLKCVKEFKEMKKLIIMIFCLLISVGVAFAGTTVTLQWSPNSEPDLAGYRMWRGTTPGGPYTQIGDDIACGPNVEICCTYEDENLADGTYYWVVTAFDTDALESVYSNEVSAVLNSDPPAAPGELSIFKKVVALIKRYYEGYTMSIAKTECE